MLKNIQFLIATVNRDNLDFFEAMNIKAQAMVLNQNKEYSVEHRDNMLMISTPTKGVGINRNIGLQLIDSEYVFIVDDDMIFNDEVNSILESAIKKYPNVDVIIFNFDYTKDGKIIRQRMKREQKITFTNCLKYGICCTLIKTKKLKQNNICFSTLFGGGSQYSCGEDSLFFLECIRAKLKIHTYIESLGRNEYRESTWFNGYDEKFFYDKGAWIACAFPKIKWIIKWYFIIRFKKLTTLPIKKIIKYINKGIDGFKELKSYDELR